MRYNSEALNGLDQRDPRHMTYKWMIEVVADENICPPLVNFLQSARNPDDTFNWDEIVAKLPVTDLRYLNPDDQSSVSHVAGWVYDFMTTSYHSDAPISVVGILPDFRSNREYDEFMQAWKSNLVFHLMGASQRGDVNRINRAAANAGLVNYQRMQELLNGDIDSQIMAAASMVNELFRPVYFYGKPLSDRDTIGFDSNPTGPSPRQKVVSRAPFHLMQIVNSFQGLQLSAGLDRNRLRSRNTQFAKGARGFDKRIDGYRKRIPKQR